jgi:hypothetical protein
LRPPEQAIDDANLEGRMTMATEHDNPAAAAAKMGENVAAQFANAANIYGGAFAGSLKAVQDYQAKLLHFFQSNAEANMSLMQKLMQARSPSDYIETVSSHMRERAAAIGDQTKELASLGQEAAKKAMDSLGQPKGS